jgi:hypothetical protein
MAEGSCAAFAGTSAPVAEKDKSFAARYIKLEVTLLRRERLIASSTLGNSCVMVTSQTEWDAGLFHGNLGPPSHVGTYDFIKIEK